MNGQLIVLISLYLTVSMVHGQGAFLNCGFINKLDCASRAIEPVCGSNSRDYQNRCYMAQAQCADNSLHIVSDKACAASGISTAAPVATSMATAPMTTAGVTVVTEPLFHNHNQLLDFFCLELMHETCPNDTGKVCGTDNMTYANYCEYEKHRCSHRTLDVKNFGDCA